MYQPATRSAVSGCGPSVVTGALPVPSKRTQVWAGVSAWASTYSPFSFSSALTWWRNAMCASTSAGSHWSIGGQGR